MKYLETMVLLQRECIFLCVNVLRNVCPYWVLYMIFAEWYSRHDIRYKISTELQYNVQLTQYFSTKVIPVYN